MLFPCNVVFHRLHSTCLRNSFLTEAKLGCNATLVEIFDAMRHPVTGVCFVARAQSLPSYTFVLWDAINWINAHVEGAVNALAKLEAMRK